MKYSTCKIASSVVAGLLALSANSLKANSVTYTLDTGNTVMSGYTGPYGSVNVDLCDPFHATITFTGYSVGGYTFLFAGAQMADVNLNATSFSVAVTTPGTTTGYSSQNVSAFGQFNVAIDNHGGNSGAVNSVIFDVTNISGCWSKATDVLMPNNKDNLMAAHIFVRDASGGNPATGYVTDSPIAVPDAGSTAALLGTGLLGLGWLRRMKAKNK